MTKRHQGDAITLAVEIRDAAGVLADPAAIAFRYRIGPDGRERSATPVKTATGQYSVTFTPDCHGNLYGAWTTTAPDRGIPAHAPIYPKSGGARR